MSPLPFATPTVTSASPTWIDLAFWCLMILLVVVCNSVTCGCLCACFTRCACGRTVYERLFGVPAPGTNTDHRSDQTEPPDMDLHGDMEIYTLPTTTDRLQPPAYEEALTMPRPASGRGHRTCHGSADGCNNGAGVQREGDYNDCAHDVCSGVLDRGVMAQLACPDSRSARERQQEIVLDCELPGYDEAVKFYTENG